MYFSQTNNNKILLPIIYYSTRKNQSTTIPEMNSSFHQIKSMLNSYFSSFFFYSSTKSEISSSQKKQSKKYSKPYGEIFVSPLQIQIQGENKITISFYYYKPSAPKKNNFLQTPLTVKINNQESVTLEKDLSRSAIILSKLLEKEIEIRSTRLFYPYLNSSIFAQYLVRNSASNTFLHFQESILSYPSFHTSSLPSSIQGIKIQLSGRILTEAVVPRLTVKSTLIGSFRQKKEIGYIDYGMFTTKNKLGAFTIKVWIAMNAT